MSLATNLSGPRGRLAHRLVLATVSVLLAVIGSPTGSVGFAAEAPASPAPTAPAMVVPAARQATNLAVITIRGEIHAVTAVSVKRRIEEAARAGADGLVFEIDSPGGEVGAVLEICTAIKGSPIANTIAWINPTAYSGGAIIALACREIVLAPAATMGDAAPIAANPLTGIMELPETERQKILAPLIAELVDSARRNGYDEYLVHAFIMLGIESWLIRDKTTGEQFFVNESEYRAIFGEEPPRGRPHVSSGQAPPSSAGLTPPPPASSPGEGSYQPPVGGLSEDTVDAVNLRLEAPPTRPSFSRADRDRFEFVHYATDGKTLLTLKEADLQLYRFAYPNALIRNDEELKRFVGATNLARLDQTWSESMVAFMTQGLSGLVIRGVLIVIFLLALFIELSMPGVGIFGLVAICALLGLVVPPLLIGASAWWAVASIGIGLALIALEVFVFPGFGIPGALGLLALIGGLMGVIMGTGRLFPGQGGGQVSDIAWAASTVGVALFVALVGMWLFTKYTHRFPVAGMLVLADRQRSDGGTDDREMFAAMVREPDAPVSPGQTGRASTPLRPSGSAEFGDRLVDVVSEFGFIEAGEPVRVVSVTKYRVGVERAPGEGGSAGGPPAGSVDA